ASLALDPAFADVDLRGMLLVDTETTGLAGGSGTLPFLIGLGWFEGESLRLHQLFLKRPGEEGPMLAFLAERIRQASCLVTYNGKTFDWPLLRTRFVMNRLKVPQPPPHLDLLHCARRVFKYRAGGTRLVQVEEEVLGHRRIGDVDGSQIPELYFRFLRGGSASALGPVIEHNAHDLVLLAALLGKLAHGLKDGGDELDPRDRLGFAQVAARAELTDRALQLARSTAAAAKGALAAEAWQLSAWLLRQQGDARGAAEAFHRALPHADRKQAPTIHFALAKLYEHSLRNLPRALEHARRTTPAEGPADQARHVARLERRLSGHSGQAPLLVD
ncbi:MAG TPA: ribonuclease H-like domain-containing protein, partial [Myxococcaceae bacterium]|nr:ribonuclease H-like domain-containing protein [Myxococcaceae bacterium]